MFNEVYYDYLLLSISSMLNIYIFRDPALFSKTTFFVDRFHNRNHSCNPIFSMKTYDAEEFQKINSQACEQLFSSLSRIATQIAYMRVDNVFFNTRHANSSLFACE